MLDLDLAFVDVVTQLADDFYTLPDVLGEVIFIVDPVKDRYECAGGADRA